MRSRWLSMFLHFFFSSQVDQRKTPHSKVIKYYYPNRLYPRIRSSLIYTSRLNRLIMLSEENRPNASDIFTKKHDFTDATFRDRTTISAGTKAWIEAGQTLVFRPQ